VFKLKGRTPFVPLIVPNLTYKVDIEVENVDPNGAADLIKVFVFNSDSTLPMITANISMPLSELNLENF
jgi:hypothetical protein